MSSVPGERIGAALGLALCLALGALALVTNAPPEPLAETASPDQASAARAMRHVRALAAEPHPPGTPAHQRALDYVLGELSALGLDPEIQEGWVVRGRGAQAFTARVRNVVGRLPGEAEGPALLLLTHYDSVPTSPGAADDAGGVAAVLEAVRALREGPVLRNDLIVLVTDGEESGLLGAHLFVDEHPWAEQVGLVLNFEARGNRGPVTLFETSEGNGALARAVADAAPHPMGSSMSYEVYRRMPNDTDLTVFLDAGLAGLNFAMIGNHPAYHTELDNPEALDQGSLQHHAGYALALARHFGNVDLEDLASPNAVYFNPVGSWMVVYPGVMGKVLAFVLLAAIFGLIVRGVETGRLEPAGLRGGLWAWLLVTVGTALAMTALWSFFTRLFPAALATPYGEPYAADLVRFAALLVGLAVASLAAAMFERPTAAELLAGLLVPWAILGWALAMFIPGAAYLLAWPTLLGLVGLAVALFGPGGAVVGAASTAGGVGAVLLFVPTAMLMSQALRVNAAAVLGALIGLGLTLLLPGLRTLLAGRLAVSATLALAGVAALAWVGASAAPGAATPAPTSLFYLVDTETSEAYWLSYEARPDAWTGQVFPAGATPDDAPAAFPSRPGTKLLSTAAAAIDLPAPTAAMLSDDFEQGVRSLAVRVRSQRGAPNILLVPDAAMASIQAMSVDGERVEIDESAGLVQLMLQSVPPEGVVVSFESLERQPLALAVIDWSWGLPTVDGVELEPRPDSLLRRPRWMTDALLVRAEPWF